MQYTNGPSLVECQIMRAVTLALSFSLLLAVPAFSKDQKVEEKTDTNSTSSTSSASAAASSRSTDPIVNDIISTIKSAKLTPEEQQEQKKRRLSRVESILNDLESKGQIPPEAKARILEGLKSDKPVHEHVPGMDANFKARFKLDDFVHDTAATVLADHLDKQDLKNLLKFLKTSTGQKLIKQAPDMVSEAVELAAAKFVPPLIELGKQFSMPGRGFRPNLTPEQMEKQKEMMDKIKDLIRQQREPKPDET